MNDAHRDVSTFDDDTPPLDSSAMEARLRSLGEQPIDPPTQSAHLTAMAVARPARSGLRDKLKVAAALAGGFLLGSTGLAFAGALPAPAQDVASEAMARVGVEVPTGTERYFGTECVAAEGGGHARNRGLYLKQERAKGAAALDAAKASDCGKPVVSLGGGDEAEGVDDVEGERPKCVDGAKVTGPPEGKGNGNGKGRHGAAAAAGNSSRACDRPEPGAAGAEGHEGEVDDEVEVDGDADESGDVDERSGAETPSSDAGPATDAPAGGSTNGGAVKTDGSSASSTSTSTSTTSSTTTSTTVAGDDDVD